ncbi:hypothetical protein QOZ80_6AG0536890 [Eleusine coracana subsp. coracana]|nr:hypothetical protein QOZ80_6AG0536890 [Eleusine coracana subsp. coracana]
MMATATTTAGCLLDAGTNYSSGSCSSTGDCFLLGWEQQPLGLFGAALAADVHELFPLFADMESSTLPARDAVVVPQDLDGLLLNFWDGSCHDVDVGAQQVQVAFNSSYSLPLPLPLPHETSSSSATTTTAGTTTNSFFPCDDYDDPLSSIFSTGPAPAAKALLQAPAAEPPSSSSSNCHADPRGSGAGGAQVQCTAATPRAPPLLPPRSISSASSLKRSTREESPDQSESSQSAAGGGKRMKPSPATTRVVCPFALLKPDGLDGGATLADINARILMRPTRPVRHPVGEFACAPRVSADQPGISGKAVSSFTRLHTPGRGTITIIRTRG